MPKGRPQPVSPAALVALAMLLSVGGSADLSIAAVLPARADQSAALRDRDGVSQFMLELADVARRLAGDEHQPAALCPTGSHPVAAFDQARPLAPTGHASPPPIAPIRPHLTDLPPPRL